MPQLGSTSGIAENVLIVSGKKNECSMASARSNCFCASGEHEVLNSTRPNLSEPRARAAGSVSAQTDATGSSANSPHTTTASLDFIARLLKDALQLGP